MSKFYLQTSHDGTTRSTSCTTEDVGIGVLPVLSSCRCLRSIDMDDLRLVGAP